MSTPQQNDIAGFWKRPLALAIDLAILFIFGYFITSWFSNFFIKFQNIGNIIGFLIAYLYFTIQDSSFGNGQTIGKRIFKLQVVDINGKTIGFAKASIRYLVFESPAFLLGMQIINPNSSNLNFWIWAILNFAFIVAIAATIYLYIFNKKTRQSLHDLAVGSYVRRCDRVWDIKERSISSIHYKVIILFIIIAFIGFLVTTKNSISSKAEIEELKKIQEIVLSENTVISADVRKTKFSYKVDNEDRTKTILTVIARYNYKIDLTDGNLSKVANEVLNYDPNIDGAEELQVIINYGVKAWIYSSNSTYGKSKTVVEWKEEYRKEIKGFVPSTIKK